MHNFLDTLTDISAKCFVFNCLQQNCLKYGCIVWTQAWRCFPHLLTAVSTMLCFRLLQTSPVTSWIH